MTLLLIALLIFATWKSKGYITYSYIFLALVLAFHYVPLIYVYLNYDDIPFSNSLEEVSDGIDRVVVACVFVYLGVLLSGLFFRSRAANMGNEALPPPINGWLRTNVVSGAIIVLNNAVAAFHSLSAGYLDIYSAGQSLTPVKTITILPIYVFSLFYLFVSWLSFRHIFSKTARYFLGTVFAAVVISFVLTGSRSTVIYLVVSMTAVYSMRFRRSVWKYFPHAAALIVGSTVIGVLREGGFAEVDPGTLLLRPIIELTNTAVVFLNSASISDELVVSGLRYISGLLYLFPVSLLSALGIVPPPLLSQQYVSIVDPGWSDMGGGFGFSVLAELYLVGGRAGAWVIALLLGCVLGWIDVRSTGSNVPKAALAASLGFLMLFVVRGEMMELYRNLFVVTLLYLLTKFRPKEM